MLCVYIAYIGIYYTEKADKIQDSLYNITRFRWGTKQKPMKRFIYLSFLPRFFFIMCVYSIYLIYI